MGERVSPHSFCEPFFPEIWGHTTLNTLDQTRQTCCSQVFLGDLLDEKKCFVLFRLLPGVQKSQKKQPICQPKTTEKPMGFLGRDHFKSNWTQWFLIFVALRGFFMVRFLTPENGFKKPPKAAESLRTLKNPHTRLQICPQKHFWKLSTTDGTKKGSKHWWNQGLAAWFRAKSTPLKHHLLADVVPSPNTRPCSSSLAMSGQPMGTFSVKRIHFFFLLQIEAWFFGITNKFNDPGPRKKKAGPVFFSQIPSFLYWNIFSVFFWILFIGKNDTDGNKPPCGKTQRQQTAKPGEIWRLWRSDPPNSQDAWHPDFSDVSDIF